MKDAPWIGLSEEDYEAKWSHGKRNQEADDEYFDYLYCDDEEEDEELEEWKLEREQENQVYESSQ